MFVGSSPGCRKYLLHTLQYGSLENLIFYYFEIKYLFSAAICRSTLVSCLNNDIFMIWGDADVTIRHCLIDSVDVTIRHLTDSALFWKDMVKYFNKVLISTSISCWSFLSPAHPHSSNPNRDQSNGYYVLMFLILIKIDILKSSPPA